MTMTIQFDGPTAAALHQQADALGVSPERLATAIVQRHVLPQEAPAHATADPEAFRRALAASVTDNEELLRRLAR
jgi:hypothetical protein